MTLPDSPNAKIARDLFLESAAYFDEMKTVAENAPYGHTLGSTGDLSELGDGAPWIWNIIREVFGNVRECLDVFHALEHWSDTGKVLYKAGNAKYEVWREETKQELLERIKNRSGRKT